jgi:acyl-CoA synthetase (AMP-forming)/AMP-acid ligase II
MNIVNYLFENTSTLKKELILGITETSTYQSVYESTFQLASFLQNKIGTGKNVILASQNSSFFIIAYLGILKSGNICVPLNPSVEQTNFDFILNKTKCKLAFISDLASKRLDIQIASFSESNIQAILANQQTNEIADTEFDGDQLAEIIFTSGSTSTPKGVMLTHNNIIANTNSIIQYLNLNEDDIMLVVLPFFYCYGLSLLHTHIRAGGQLVLNNNFIFLASTINNINKYNCTGFAGVPSHFQILLRKTNSFRNTIFPTLRYVTQAGGKLPNAFINEFIESFPSIPFFVMYGQTEATARLSYLPPNLIKEKPGSIGKGIPDVELMVVDDKDQEVQPDNLGEIRAKGKNIMAGYFNAPEETARTIRNGWLYTGDLAIIDKDGYIYITSRKNEMIKVGGRRISPKEIEEVISLIPGVIDCTIEGVDDEILNQAIKAILIISEDASYLNEEFVRHFCSSKLSNHKIPTYFEFKTKLILSATGKRTKDIST